MAFDVLPSTQAEAIRRLHGGAAPPFTIVAREQSGGRGRLDHRWSSPVGGLYLSRAVAEPRGPSGLLPVGIGSALSRDLEAGFKVRTSVKWPNDLLAIDGAQVLGKLGGILVDRLAPRDGPATLVIGLGLNACPSRSDFPATVVGRVAILSEQVGRPVPPEELEPVALAAVASTVGALSTTEGTRAVWEESRRRLYGVGRPVRVDGRAAGSILGLGEDGALLVEKDGAVSHVRSGEIVVGEGS